MRDENDFEACMGKLFTRLCRYTVELGEPAGERAVRDLLRVLGASALREAEARAVILRDRGRRPGDLRVRPFCERGQPEPWAAEGEAD